MMDFLKEAEHRYRRAVFEYDAANADSRESLQQAASTLGRGADLVQADIELCRRRTQQRIKIDGVDQRPWLAAAKRQVARTPYVQELRRTCDPSTLSRVDRINGELVQLGRRQREVNDLLRQADLAEREAAQIVAAVGEPPESTPHSPGSCNAMERASQSDVLALWARLRMLRRDRIAKQPELLAEQDHLRHRETLLKPELARAIEAALAPENFKLSEPKKAARPTPVEPSTAGLMLC